MQSPQFWPEQPISPVTPFLKPDQFGGSEYLNNVTRFSTVAHLYTQTYAKNNDGKFNGSDVIYSIYLAYEDNTHPPYIIIDRDGLVKRSPRDLALQFIVDGLEFKQATKRIPKKIHGTLKGVLESHGHYIPDDDDEWDLGEELEKARICLIPIQKLKNPKCLRQFDWLGFTQLLARWEFNRDPSVVLAEKAHLLRGVEPRANPHSALITNGGTGKSSFYRVTTGKVFDKVTRNSLLGYARGPDEIHPGTLNGVELPVAIDQVESGEWGILDTVFNLMEFGEASLSSGSVELNISCKAPIALLGNVTDHSSAEKGLESILSHLTANPTIGRRLGVLLYGNNYKTITQRSSQQSWYEWEKNAQFYRAVEEYALPRLETIYHDESVWSWLGTPIEGYGEAVDTICKSMDPGLVKRFCLEHGHSGQSRVRGAALSISIAEHLDLIALGEHTVEEILEHAEDLLHEIAAINLESIRNLVENAVAEIQASAEAYYRGQPEYVQIIIRAVEYARRSGIPSNTFYLSSLRDEFETGSEAYTHLSKCVYKLKQKKRGKARLNKRLREFYGFMFEPRDGDLEIVLDPDFYSELLFLNISPVRGVCETGENSEPVKTVKKQLPKPGISYMEKLEHIMATIQALDPEALYKVEDLAPFIKLEPEEIKDALDRGVRDSFLSQRLDKYGLTQMGKKAARGTWKREALR